MKATRTGTRCDFRFQISDSRLAYSLVEKVFDKFQTHDVLQIAERAGVKIVYQKWFPVTLGEFDWRTKTITVNENADILSKNIIAHELGHYFLREFGVENVYDEEMFCDEFAGELLENLERFHAEARKTQS